MNVRLTLADARGRAGVADVELLELALSRGGRVGHGVGGGEERKRHEGDEEERDASVHGDERCGWDAKAGECAKASKGRGRMSGGCWKCD